MVDIAELCVCLNVFQKCEKKLTILLVDEYDVVKHLLTTNTSITSGSFSGKIAKALIVEY